MARITTAIRARVESILNSGVDTVNADSVNTNQAEISGERVERRGPQPQLLAGLRKHLVGYWTLGDLSDGLVDQVNDNNIQVEGNPSVVTNGGAGFGDAVQFGGGTWGRIDHDGELSVEDGPFTLEAYFRMPNISNSATVFFKRARNGTNGDQDASYYLQVGTGGSGVSAYRGELVAGYGANGGIQKVRNNRSDSGSNAPTQFLPEGPLQHAIMTFDPDQNRVSVFVNGRYWASTSLNNPPFQNNAPVFLGAGFGSDGSVKFNNEIILSHVAIYDAKLELSSIKRQHRQPYASEKTLNVEKRATVTSDGYADPTFRYDSTKTEPYRLMITNNNSGGQTELWTGTDPANLSQAATGLFANTPDPSTTIPADFIEDSGTYYIFATVGSTGSRKTRLLSGSDWTTPFTDNGEIIPDTDVGAFQNKTGRVFLYGEDRDFEDGVGSNKIALWTAESPTGTYTERDTILDLTDTPWKAGDADVVKFGNTYWMTIDATSNHPKYGTALLKSQNLYDWELVDEDITNTIGGDLTVKETPEGTIGYTEFGGDQLVGGIGLWDVSGPE